MLLQLWLMCCLVLLEVVLAAKALVTQRTREGLVSAVDATVTGELLIAGEAFATSIMVTGKGPLPCVYPQVALQLSFVTKG